MRFSQKSKWFAACCCLCLLLLPAALLGVNPAYAAQGDDRELAKQLQAVLEGARAACKAPGAMAGVWKGSFAWTSAQGQANLAQKIPMNTSQVWRIGSVSKTFTATVILRLCDQGLLSLDQTLGHFRPSFPAADKITLRQLLQHNAGIFSWDEDEPTRLAILKHPERKWTREGMIKLAADKTFYFKPGAGHHYSNVGYFLLGEIIEKVTHKPLAQVIAEEIAQPLKLRHTYLAEGPRYRDEVIHGYMIEHGVLRDISRQAFAKVINYDLAFAAGGMVSTLDDLKVWLRALASGKLLSRRLHREQLRIAPHSGKGGGYGLGVVLARGWLGHSGGVAGSMCNAYINPGQDTVIVQYFNLLDPVDIERNAADLKVLGGVLKDMARLVGAGI